MNRDYIVDGSFFMILKNLPDIPRTKKQEGYSFGIEMHCQNEVFSMFTIVRHLRK
jgi:hypothetical protein